MITYSYHKDSFFDGCDLAGVDVDATLDRLDTMTATALQEAFPGHEVEIDRNGSHGSRFDMTPEPEGFDFWDFQAECQAICERVFSAGEFWVAAKDSE